jgi:hypothetical protein
VVQARKRKHVREAALPIVDVARDRQRLAKLLPDIDPGDLDLILTSLARPFGSGRRFFLREIKPGVYVY